MLQKVRDHTFSEQARHGISDLLLYRPAISMELVPAGECLDGSYLGDSQAAATPVERANPRSRLCSDRDGRLVGMKLVKKIPEPTARTEDTPAIVL